MSYTVTKYPHGTFSWADVASTDIQKSTKFLEALFGWTSKEMPTDREEYKYTMYYLDGKVVAGGGRTMMPSMPSYWNNYVTVENVDEIAKKVVSLGGKILMDPMDVVDAGRMVPIEDPTGAKLNLWQPKRHIGAQIVNTVGAMCWNELYTHDVEKAKEFYADLLGWTYEVDKNNNDYIMIKNNGRSNGGIFQITPEMGKMPPNWLVYFTVRNVEDTIAKTKELGGQVYMPLKEINIGKIATLADPTGAAFMVLAMSIQPTQWEE